MFRTATIVLLSIIASSAVADDRAQFFENRIRPVLVKHCFDCHAADGEDLSGGLLLDSKPGWQRGGESGAAIVVGKPDQSRLLEAIAYTNRDLQMPPDNRLPQSVVADFRKWIQDGAVDPRVEEQRPVAEEFDLIERKQGHWAWQPRMRFSDEQTIDSFVNVALQRRGISPSSIASAHQLVRRIYFDLIGLPPKPLAIQSFERTFAANPQQAIEQHVSQLLDDPRFGEKWASHWFDVVDYSETKGHVTDQERPFGWKYRDYVIDALNDDLPYDRFVTEHIAGDLLPTELHRPGRNGETNVAPTATGVLFMHEMHFMAVNPVQQRWDEIDAQIDMVGKAFLGLTLECARCHDHKFDAISQDDYYALAGFFYSTEQGKQRTAPREPVARHLQPKLETLEKDYHEFLDKKRQARIKALTPKNKSGAYFPVSEELGLQTTGDTANILQKMKAISEVDPSWSQWVRSAVEVTGQDVPLLVRGETSNPGKVVPRRFLTAISGPAPDKLSGSGRLWLAERVTDRDNPLTARLHANRTWHHLFGRGIVATPNDFGKLGKPPSLPQLLDHLANRLIDNGWSTKALIREIMLSETYQRSSAARADLADIDPENSYFAKQNRRRLTAEQLRDAMLSVSEVIDPAMYGPGIDPFVPSYTTANKTVHIPKSGPLDGANRRSIYIKARRNFFDPFLRTFDFPDRGKPVGRRDVTITPNQALAMLNSPLVHELAADWGVRLASMRIDPEQKLQQMWISALGRSATDDELHMATELVTELSSEDLDGKELWKHVAHFVFNYSDFSWVD